MTDTTLPDRLSAEPACDFCDIVKLDRGIHVFLGEKKYLDVEECHSTEG